jgi:hypothetical protein
MSVFWRPGFDSWPNVCKLLSLASPYRLAGPVLNSSDNVVAVREHSTWNLFQNRVLREISLCQIEHVFILWKIDDLYSSVTIRKVIESIHVPWPEHVAPMGTKC